MFDKIKSWFASWFNPLGNIIPKPKPHSLNWTAQYLNRFPDVDDTTIIHYAKTRSGIFEIYESEGYGSQGRADYLLLFPTMMFRPAELFDDIEAAKDRAEGLFTPTK